MCEIMKNRYSEDRSIDMKVVAGKLSTQELHSLAALELFGTVVEPLYTQGLDNKFGRLCIEEPDQNR